MSRARQFALPLVLPLAALAAGCTGDASAETGVTAYLRVAKAQFVPGTLAVDANGSEPAVRQVALATDTFRPGQVNVPVTGSVEKGSTVLIGLGGDSGYWIVPTGLVDAQLPDNYDFSAQLSFSPLTPVGKFPLIFRGVAPDGTVGPAQAFNLSFETPAPAGALVITLQWDTESDLDLHALVPNPSDPTTPIEIWWKAAVGVPVRKPGDPAITPDQVAAAGTLDFDSNAACVIDGRRQENVIFATAPPPGDYAVRVDASSLCGQPDAQWQVTAALADGTQLGFAQWVATDADTRGTHTAGAGRLAFTFSIPETQP